MRHVRRRGPYLRVADPSWRDPLSGEYAREHGGRWNPPHSFGVVYLNQTVDVARAQVRHKLGPLGIEPEDLMVEEGPVLIHTDVPGDRYVDAVTAEGLKSLGLPETYPRNARGAIVEHAVCQPLGQQARDAGEPGIACRSAATSAPPNGVEIAYFARRDRVYSRVEPFADWYW